MIESYVRNQGEWIQKVTLESSVSDFLGDAENTPLSKEMRGLVPGDFIRRKNGQWFEGNGEFS